MKVSFQYWGEGKSDPRRFADSKQVERIFMAERDSFCDETFDKLSQEGDIEYLDPELRPSRFVRIPGKTKTLPSPGTTLPCYVLK